MTEAEVLQFSFSANEAVASVFPIFLAIVSAYIAGLYFFTHRASLMLKVIAFALLTIGFLFIGQSMSGIEVRILGLVESLNGLPVKTTGLEKLNNPIFPVPVQALLDWAGVDRLAYDGNRAGNYTGRAVSMLVDASLFYATFIYLWPDSQPLTDRQQDSNN